MEHGNAFLTACSTFAITNIDELFVLVTFFAEAATKKTLTPLTIVAGQCLGFTIVICISLIGFAAAVVLPTQPIGFLSLLPILIGISGLLDLFVQDAEDDDEEVGVVGWRAVSKVATIAVINGGDNIGTYIPLFAQARNTDMLVYLVTYYVLLGVLFFLAWLVMQQKDVLRLTEKYAHAVVPFLYMGIGVYIIVASKCYPWLAHRVEVGTPFSGVATMVVTTSAFLIACVGGMVFLKLRKGRDGASSETLYTEVAGNVDGDEDEDDDDAGVAKGA